MADRGVEAMARTLRKPLPEDVDFMHASREEMANLRRSLYPLTRKLAARLARRRKYGRRGPLDFRKTIRHSLSYGGVPVEPKFKYPRPSKPEIMVIADISGSVAAFARFTLHLLYAISSQFSKVRSFVFIDGKIDANLHRWVGSKSRKPSTDLCSAMSVAIGEIEVTSKKLRFKLASENTIKGAAGSGVLMAELLLADGVIHDSNTSLNELVF